MPCSTLCFPYFTWFFPPGQFQHPLLRPYPAPHSKRLSSLLNNLHRLLLIVECIHPPSPHTLACLPRDYFQRFLRLVDCTFTDTLALLLHLLLLFVFSKRWEPPTAAFVCWLGAVSPKMVNEANLGSSVSPPCRVRLMRWQKCWQPLLSGRRAFSPLQRFSASLLQGLQLWFCRATRAVTSEGLPGDFKCWGFSGILSRCPYKALLLSFNKRLPSRSFAVQQPSRRAIVRHACHMSCLSKLNLLDQLSFRSSLRQIIFKALTLWSPRRAYLHVRGMLRFMSLT